MLGFRSKITIKLLEYYFLNPEKKNYINELADILKIDPGNLFRKLKELEAEGIFISETHGNQKYFGLNKKYPLLKEIKKTFEAKYGLINLLKDKLSKLNGLKEAYIFGSYANNSLQQESDIDIFLVGSHSSLEAKRLILPLQQIYKREFNFIDLTSKELDKRKKQKDNFVQNIYSQKMIKVY